MASATQVSGTPMASGDFVPTSVFLQKLPRRTGAFTLWVVAVLAATVAVGAFAVATVVEAAMADLTDGRVVAVAANAAGDADRPNERTVTMGTRRAMRMFNELQMVVVHPLSATSLKPA